MNGEWECEWRMSVRDLGISIAKPNGLNKEEKVEKRSETSVNVGGSVGEGLEEKRNVWQREEKSVACCCDVLRRVHSSST